MREMLFTILLMLLHAVLMSAASYTLKRVSVHDPSIVLEPASQTYYIFGSHRAAAKTTDLMSWTSFQAPWQNAYSSNCSNSAAFTTPQVTKMKKGGAEVDFAFDAQSWAKRGSTSYNVDGNMWAPDVIWNKAMQKWCMYLSINGDNWYSSIILLTSDKIIGPYRYQAPVVMSGFHTGTSYKDTDLEIVLGILGAYTSWGNQAKGNYGERSQGHNSIIAAEDGRTYLVYHTRFQNWGEIHQVRVHQVFQNKNGWLVVAPFEYTGEQVTSADIAITQQVAADKIAGKYKLLVHHYKLDHTSKATTSPVDIELNMTCVVVASAHCSVKVFISETDA